MDPYLPIHAVMRAYRNYCNGDDVYVPVLVSPSGLTYLVHNLVTNMHTSKSFGWDDKYELSVLRIGIATTTVNVMAIN